jgi:hypothetical protein
VFGWRYGYVAVVPLPLLRFVEWLGPGAAAVPRWQRRMLVPACLALFAVALVRHESWHPDSVAFGQLYVWAAGVDFVAYDYGNEAGEPAHLDTAFLRVNGPS